ncbi:2-hydroxychromene-2-carboxylate isomerase [Aliiglaciecola sp. CAU 1673]|uniref:2-hydroxychromene-2-carboxylate isomerase n=1 Tax=Aliiglaciecola sp. CAU 1673 TaxID=3032595 RepID=UPI0023D98D03|nr:2-hydroxychromene-2-carboxylate isomerase [Aliiglaciecola sp. CAU 1673]MDF2176955.1 2-hydroxychromene-2-carboxylate isomerase [Aliiglaciecola sp. CAU 1673]
MQTIDFWFDFASPYSYLAAMRVEKLATEAGVSLRWRAFLLGAIFKSHGLDNTPMLKHPHKANYMWRDMQRLCADIELVWQQPSEFPRNGLIAARIACWYEQASWLPEFVRQVYCANFQQDKDIADTTVLAHLLIGLGLDPQQILTNAQSQDAKDKLRQSTEEAMQSGVFGAPFFIAAEEPFWGQDRLEHAVAWCQARRR